MEGRLNGLIYRSMGEKLARWTAVGLINRDYSHDIGGSRISETELNRIERDVNIYILFSRERNPNISHITFIITCNSIRNEFERDFCRIESLSKSEISKLYRSLESVQFHSGAMYLIYIYREGNCYLKLTSIDKYTCNTNRNAIITAAEWRVPFSIIFIGARQPRGLRLS